jgi:hypothetical protein
LIDRPEGSRSTARIAAIDIGRAANNGDVATVMIGDQLDSQAQML